MPEIPALESQSLIPLTLDLFQAVSAPEYPPGVAVIHTTLGVTVTVGVSKTGFARGERTCGPWVTGEGKGGAQISPSWRVKSSKVAFLFFMERQASARERVVVTRSRGPALA